MSVKHIFAIVLTAFCALSLSTAACSDEKINIVKHELDNGLTAIIKPEPGTQIVAISAYVKAGSDREIRQNAGIANFVTRLLLASTVQHSAKGISRIANEVGGNVATNWDHDFAKLHIVTTSYLFNDAMDLAGEALTQAVFEDKWVEKARAEILNEIQKEDEVTFDYVYTNLRELMYQDNGYNRPSYGSERTVRLASKKDLAEFYKTWFVPNNTVISVVGDVTVEHAIDRIEKAWAGVPAGKLPKTHSVSDEKMDKSRLYTMEADIELAYLMLGWLAPEVASEDYPAVSVLTTALGRGKGSLMFRNLRQKHGMGYDLGAEYKRLSHQAHVMAFVLTDPFKVSSPYMQPRPVLEEVHDKLLEQVEHIKQNGIDEQELERAKGYTAGHYLLSQQHIMHRASELAWLEAVGLGYDYFYGFAEAVDKVTATDVQKAANNYLNEYAAVLVLPRIDSTPTVD